APDCRAKPARRNRAPAAGEAAEPGDVDIARDDRRGGAALAGHADRAAAVSLGVPDRGIQRGAVAAEHPAGARSGSAGRTGRTAGESTGAGEGATAQRSTAGEPA